jgi:hypothetical protein
MRAIRGLTLGLGLLAAGAAPAVSPTAAEGLVGVGHPAPEITGGPWINSGALSLADLRGRVVLVEFWTYG